MTGITITPHQVEEANQNAQRHKVAGKVRFERRDFTVTGYPDNLLRRPALVHQGAKPQTKA